MGKQEGATVLKPSLSKQLNKVFTVAYESAEGKKHFSIVPRDQIIQFEPEDGEPFHVKVSLKGEYEIGEGVVPFKRYYVSRMKSSWESLNKLLTGDKSFTDTYMDDEIEIYGEWDIRNWFGTLLRIAKEVGGRI
jgi:hypothetical protein